MCIVQLSATVKGDINYIQISGRKKNQTWQYLVKAPLMCRAFILISVSLKIEKGMDVGGNTDWLGSVSPVLLCPRPRHVPCLE